MEEKSPAGMASIKKSRSILIELRGAIKYFGGLAAIGEPG